MGVIGFAEQGDFFTGLQAFHEGLAGCAVWIVHRDAGDAGWELIGFHERASSTGFAQILGVGLFLGGRLLTWAQMWPSFLCVGGIWAFSLPDIGIETIISMGAPQAFLQYWAVLFKLVVSWAWRRFCIEGWFDYGCIG